MSIPVDIKSTDSAESVHEEKGKCLLSRRQFLLYSGGAAAATTVPISLFSGAVQASARVVGYPRKHIANLSDLKVNQPVSFKYPDDGANANSQIVKMGVPGGGGVGPDRDVVAFNMFCTHQGGMLSGSYQANGEHRSVGQCPFHLSTYDLRRHGIIISGQAYESLPQVVLELEGDKIYAVGMLGLIFGRDANLMDS